MSELKPCPFCGGEPTVEREEIGFLTITCPNCAKPWSDVPAKDKWAADFDFCGWDETSDEAVIAAWNRRAIDRDALLKIADELEEPWCLEEGYETVEGIMHVAEEYERAVAERIRKAVGA